MPTIIKPAKPFLTAVWSNLLFINYAIRDGTLTPFLPPGLELDRWEGQAWLSLVAFDFSNTVFRGMPVLPLPGLRDFPEVNLRFYVRQGERRGVVFVREFVPNPMVAAVAHMSYNEPYGVARMSSQVTKSAEFRHVQHEIRAAGDKHIVSVSATEPPVVPPPGDLREFLCDQEWGFGRTRAGKLTRFRVIHPVWRVLEVESYEIMMDFNHLFGDQWRILQDRAPDLVFLAEGSAVSVLPIEPDTSPAGPQMPRSRKA